MNAVEYHYFNTELIRFNQQETVTSSRCKQTLLKAVTEGGKQYQQISDANSVNI